MSIGEEQKEIDALAKELENEAQIQLMSKIMMKRRMKFHNVDHHHHKMSKPTIQKMKNLYQRMKT